MYTPLLVVVAMFQISLAANWAVIVNTSKFWYDYRHASNLLTMYQTLRRQGYDDSKIIVLNAATTGCDARNLFPGTQFDTPEREINLYEQFEVDYRGLEVTPAQVLGLLANRLDENVPLKKRLQSDSSSNILLYFTGHGGDGFIKFQDSTSLSAGQLAAAINEMHIKRRFKSMLVIVDSCQADTLGELISTPNVSVLSSSSRRESSYSLYNDPDIGVSVIDGFTFAIGRVLNHPESRNFKMSQLAHIVASQVGHSTPVLRGSLNSTVATIFDQPQEVVGESVYLSSNLL